MEEKRCYTVKEIMQILDVSRVSVYELLKQKEFRCVLVGGKYRISKKSFDEWLDRGCALNVSLKENVDEITPHHRQTKMLDRDAI